VNKEVNVMKRLLVLFALLLAACNRQGNVPLAIPSGLKATAGDKSVYLTWNANTESDLKGYVVSVTLADGALISNNPVNASATQLTMSDLSNGTTYTFRIAAENAVGNRSEFSSPITAIPGVPSVAPAKPTGLTASAQNSQVLLAWNKNLEPDLKGYRLRYGNSATSLDQSKSLPASALSTVVGPLTNGTPFFFALEAENNAGQKSPRTDVLAATPQGALLAPIISSYSITGYGNSTQVRQGVGGIEIVLQGERLEALSSAKLLGAFDLSITDKQASSAKLFAIVPHGIEIGLRTLLVSSSAGEVAVNDAIEISKITAAKTPGLNPSDTSGLGTPNKPYLTLSKALSMAGTNDTVLLGAGTYSAGETWPQGSISPVATNVPAGLTIEGQSSDRGAVLLEGTGATGLANALSLEGSGTIRNLTVRGFNSGIRLEAGSTSTRLGALRIDNVAAIDNRSGVLVFNAERLELSQSVFANNASQGLLTRGVSQVQLSQSQWSGNGLGIDLRNAGTQASSAILGQLSIVLSSTDGISVRDVSLDLSNTRSAQNQGNGLFLAGRPGFVALRTGTLLEQNGFGFDDQRSPDQGSITATRYLLPGSGLSISTVFGPAQLGTYYRILNAGNVILFQ
jgi:Fibronectin type III domain/Right handed beta helix region